MGRSFVLRWRILHVQDCFKNCKSLYVAECILHLNYRSGFSAGDALVVVRLVPQMWKASNPKPRSQAFLPSSNRGDRENTARWGGKGATGKITH